MAAVNRERRLNGEYTRKRRFHRGLGRYHLSRRATREATMRRHLQ
jgi:hypothetical protein